jgi:2-succinyl-5-enolpyruvyl-6-hydroxy-3-cyclohexene-1-carboxylate synthase
VQSPLSGSPAAHPDPVYRFTRAFFQELELAGLRDVVVSPGSRSTPLAVSAAWQRGLRCWSQIDERSAGFFALGLALASRRPVALVCTSGTAAANYLPAVIEAHYARVPLLVLTADRPPEAREWGAGQTIDQLRLYGSHLRWFAELPVPGESQAMLRYCRSLACRAVSLAGGRPPGPVHLNWPFREPLEPRTAPPAEDPASAERGAPAAYSEVCESAASPTEEQVEALHQLALAHPRAVIACGPDRAGPEQAQAVAELARAAPWPILADPTSQLRCGPHCADAPILSAGDHLLRESEFAAAHAPDLVLRIGGTPVSKAFRLWLERHAPRQLVLVDPDGGWNEPSHLASRVLRVDPAQLCLRLARRLAGAGAGSEAREWTRDFLRAERRALDRIAAILGEQSELLEAQAVRELARALPDGALLVVSNSLPVRDLDAYLPSGTRRLRVLANRGANGIDGVVSTALGAAAADGGPVVLLTGDLAFLHDLGGLLAAHRHRLRLTILVLNNDGGGIFSLLPVARHGEAVAFESLFRTPHGLDLGRAAAAFGVEHVRAETAPQLRDALAKALEAEGTRLVEVPVEPERSLEQRRAVAEAVSRALKEAETSPGGAA